MSNAAALNDSRSGRSRTKTPVFFFLSPLVTLAVPRLTWLFLPLIATTLVVPVLRRGCGWRQLIEPNIALAAVLLVSLYIFLNATWAANHGAAFEKATLFLGVVLVTFAGSRAIAAFDKQELRRAAVAFAAGAFLGAVFLLCELLTDGAITRMAMNSIPFLKPDTAKHVVISQGQVTKLSLSELNHNVGMLMFYLWPGLLALRTVEGGSRRAVLIGLFVLAVAVPVILSEHASSQVALIVSLLVFLLAWTWRRLVVRALAVLWCVAFVLVLPLDFLAYRAELHQAPWLPISARARVILWEYTAERVLDHPWLGIGAASTRALKEQRVVAEQPEGFIFPRTTGQHAHNLFLQTWYELGVVGAILIAFAGAVMALRITLLPFEVQPFAAATFAVFVTIAAFAWGIWQTWLMCAVGLALLSLRTASAIQDGTSDPANQPVLSTPPLQRTKLWLIESARLRTRLSRDRRCGGA